MCCLQKLGIFRGQEGLMKDTFELDYGKCGIQHFWGLNHTRNLKLMAELKENKKKWMKIGLPPIKIWKCSLPYFSGSSTSSSFSKSQLLRNELITRRAFLLKFMQRPQMALQ